MSYPAGESKVLGSLGTEKVALYEGKVEFTARLKLADDARAGPVKVSLILNIRPATTGFARHRPNWKSC